MESIFEIIGKAVLAVGGAGVILLGLSSYISKYFAKWFLQKEKARYEKEIELYKIELDKELEKVKQVNEKNLFADKMVFEYEYEIIKEIMPLEIRTYDCCIKVLFVLAMKEKDTDEANQLLDTISKMLQNYYNEYIQYAVFLPEKVYLSMQSRYKELNELVYQLYQVLKGRGDKSTFSDIVKTVQDGQQQFLDNIRSYYRG